MAAVWIYDIAVNYTTFGRTRKPDLRAMNFLLAAMCTALGVFFSVTIWQQFIG